jgi:hypothetical protein
MTASSGIRLLFLERNVCRSSMCFFLRLHFSVRYSASASFFLGASASSFGLESSFFFHDHSFFGCGFGGSA